AKETLEEGDAEVYVSAASESSLSPTRSEDDDSETRRRRALADLERQNPVFGDFVRREQVASFARFQIREADGVRAVLFINFAEQTEFTELLKQGLRRLVADVSERLPDVRDSLRTDISSYNHYRLASLLQYRSD